MAHKKRKRTATLAQLDALLRYQFNAYYRTLQKKMKLQTARTGVPSTQKKQVLA